MIEFQSFDGFPEEYVKFDLAQSWLQHCAQVFDYKVRRITYQFCDEKTMLHYNREYLDHDYYTDILTFPENRKTNPISGDILINVDRLVDNAKDFEESIQHELLRLMAHGLLHLMGMTDENEDDRKRMTTAENRCIKLYFELFSH